jgi:hypothetical protein
LHFASELRLYGFFGAQIGYETIPSVKAEKKYQGQYGQDHAVAARTVAL